MRISLVRRRVVSDASLPVDSIKTQQQFADECDINLIVAKAQRGIAPRYVNGAVPRYGDFSRSPSLAEAFEVVSQAREAFMTLPAAARAELGNDFTRINSVDREFYARHGLLKKTPSGSATGVPGEPEGVETPSRSKPPKAASKAAKAAIVDQDDQE